MNPSIRSLILICAAAICASWLVGFATLRSTAQVRNEYHTCVQLVMTGAIPGTVDACKAERDLLRSLR